MVAEIRPNYPTEWAAMKAVAAKLGIGAAETVRTWVRKAEVDTGTTKGPGDRDPRRHDRGRGRPEDRRNR
jgi:transposase